MSQIESPQYNAIIVGAGFSGLGAAIKLDQAGLGDYLIVEAGDGVGGTWHWNTYPGIAVDIPSFSYQFSFDQRTDWSRTYAPGAELKNYAESIADKYDLRPKIRFNTKIDEATYDDLSTLWRLRTTSGEELTARFLIGASGVLTQPKLPEIDGVESFKGLTMHTARWDHDQDLRGKRVAVIGTGASAIQLIPEIAPDVADLTVFQRTPIWCFPKPDLPLPGVLRWGLKLPGARTAVRLASQGFVETTFPIAAQYHSYFPLTGGMEHLGRRWLKSQVKDPKTREQLTPDYGLGCKRPSFHNTYLATYNRENVHLETNPITKVTPTGVRTADGVLHKIDVLILATGFKVMESDNIPTFTLRGSSGGTMAEFFQTHRLQSYQGVSLPGFPNYFTVFGPYGYNGSSYFTLIEAQTHHIVRVIKHALKQDAHRVEVTEEANQRYFEKMLSRRKTQVFWQDSCNSSNSYYFDTNGDVPLRRATTAEVLLEARTFPLKDYDYVRVAQPAPDAFKATGVR